MTQRSSDWVQCYIHGVNRVGLLKICADSGYTNESSIIGSIDDGLIEGPATFATEAAFLAEHERLSRLAKEVVPSTTVETLYYAANEETPKYSRTS
jgi:hypothetical protein